jgi:hypothetical protein
MIEFKIHDPKFHVPFYIRKLRLRNSLFIKIAVQRERERYMCHDDSRQLVITGWIRALFGAHRAAKNYEAAEERSVTTDHFFSGGKCCK